MGYASSVTERGRRHGSGELLWQLAVVGGLVIGAITVIAAVGPGLARDLRESLLWLTPRRASLFALALGAVSAVVSSARWRNRDAVASSTPTGIPVVALLGLVVVAAATFRLLLVRAATEPRFFGDELAYTDLAKSWALDGRPLLRGETELARSLLYPLLMSPLHLLADDGARAYEATKAVNAVLVGLSGIPAYLLARRIATPGLALVVAALVAFAPWTAYASLVLTEPLFLPAFTTFVLLMARMLERPSPRRQAGVLAALAVLIGIRPQAVFVAGALLASILVQALRGPSVGSVLRRYAPVLLGLGAATAGMLVLFVAGKGLGRAARPAAEGVLDPVGLVSWTLWNLAVYELALGVAALAVFPFALGRLLRSSREGERATGTALLTCSIALGLSTVAVSAAPSGLDILHERYLFAATPLVLVGLAYWVRTGAKTSRRWRVVAAALAVAVAATLPADQIARANNVESPTATWVAELHRTLPGVPTRALLVGLAVIGGVVLVGFRGRVAPFAAVAVAFTALVCGLDYSGAIAPGQTGPLAWVDRALPTRARASLIYLGYQRPDQPCADGVEYEQQGLTVLTEFFNSSVDRVYRLGSANIGRDNLPSPSLTVAAGGVVREGERSFAPRYAVLDSRQPVVGRRLARLDLASLGTQYQEGSSLTLWQVEPPLRFLPHAQPLPPRADGRPC
jgi:hypothetical protein